MYTQCPDCEIAFKITADVLKQAAGKVRCGGCGNAFNALLYLSEHMPKRPTPETAGADVPELRPEIIDTDDGLPKSISAEQSAALLKTLDQLAGSDIRIEDTGIEWRVLDEQEAALPAADDDDAAPADEQVMDIRIVDEFLDNTETPIDEFLTATPEVVDSPEIFAAAAIDSRRSSVDELRFDDNTPLPDSFDLDDESSYRPEPVVNDQDELDDVEEPAFEEVKPEVTLSEPDEWADILGEFQDLVEDIVAPIEPNIEQEVSEDPSIEDSVPDEPVTEVSTSNTPLDMNSQFALQAEAMGIDLSGIENLDAEGDVAPESVEDIEASLEEEPEEDLEVTVNDKIGQLDLIDDQLIDDQLINDQEEPSELIEEPIVESHTIEAELAESKGDPTTGDGNDPGEHYVPPLTEEEYTINMQIDQDLMALAIEDEDGFASTIVIPEKDAEKIALEEIDDESQSIGQPNKSDDDVGIETIVMEGEFVRSAIDGKKLATDAAAAANLADMAITKDAELASESGNHRVGIIAGVVILALVFIVQLMHQSREALATIPAFSNTVGQVYRALGQPVQPAWDITGWRFEATKGNTEGEAEELTVYSRLGNNSDSPLPYPLIGISLTDRFEETIGSRTLDPNEYLPTNLDPRKLVEPGNTFNAVITIKSATEDATGFKLSVCYRLSDGQLRCAIDDFK